MNEIYIKIFRNTMSSHNYHIFRVNSKKKFSLCIFYSLFLRSIQHFVGGYFVTKSYDVVGGSRFMYRQRWPHVYEMQELVVKLRM